MDERRVILKDDAAVVGTIRWGHQVAASDGDWIELQLLSSPIDHRLHDEYAVWHASPSIRTDYRRIGVDGNVLSMNRADLYGPGMMP